MDCSNHGRYLNGERAGQQTVLVLMLPHNLKENRDVAAWLQECVRDSMCVSQCVGGGVKRRLSVCVDVYVFARISYA